MVSEETTPLCQQIPDGVQMSALFADWKDARHTAHYDEAASDDSALQASGRYDELSRQITAFKPITPADLAIQVLVETDHGTEEFHRSFFESLIALAESAPTELIARSPRIIDPARHYRPKLDMDNCSIAELRQLSDLLWSLSEIINATIGCYDVWEVRSFLDDLQGLVNAAAIQIAEQAFIAGPPVKGGKSERQAWNWLIARAQVQCAEGEIRIEGDGVPNLADTGEAA